MIWMNRFFAVLLYGLAILFVAGLVHIVSILVMPRLAPHDAFARLSAIAKTKQPFLLPPPLPGKELTPFEDPAVVEAVCMFDLAQAPFHVSATIGEDALVTLSFRSRTGKIFYSMTDKASVHGKIDISVMTEPQLEAAQANDDEDNPPQELRIVAPQLQGFLLIGALAAHPSERAAAEARALSIQCAPETVAQN